MVYAELHLLWYLLPLYLLWTAAVIFLTQRNKKRQRSAIRYSSIKKMKRSGVQKKIVLRKIVETSRFLTIALMLVAMTRPQSGRKETQIATEGIDIVLAIDTSGSMRALDLDTHAPIAQRRNRLQVVKDVVGEFVSKRPNDQIGMVVFGQEAFTQCPLTLDHGVLDTFLEHLEIGMAGEATAIGSAIGTAVKRLKDSKAKSKVLILLTDGRNNAGALSPQKAAEVAQTFGIKIYAIGAGTKGQAPFIVDSLFGKQVVYDDVRIDDASLTTLAEKTGGAYFRAQDAESLTNIYEKIDKLEKSEITQPVYLEYNDDFEIYLFPALGLLLLEIVLLGTRLRKIP